MMSSNDVIIDVKSILMVSSNDVDLEMIDAKYFAALSTVEQTSFLYEETNKDYVLIKYASEDKNDVVDEKIWVSSKLFHH